MSSLLHRAQRRVRWEVRLSHMLLALSALACAAFVVSSNDGDWDQFLAAAEADFRSWKVDHLAPTWSNQLCGGVTRIGDPQAMGLSPLFLLPLLLGTFWGLKALTLSGLASGVWGLAGVISLFVTGGRSHTLRSRRQRAAVWLISFTCMCGDAVLWHLHIGHVPFFLHGVVVALLRGLMTSVMQGATWGRLTWLTLGSWALWSSGFYLSLIFFTVPLSLALVLAGLMSWRKVPVERRRTVVRNVALALAALAAGTVIASYKWLAVMEYQRLHPRTVEAANDGVMLWELLVLQLQPVVHGQFAFFDVPRAWGIWEYGGFSLAAWLCVVLGAAALLRRKPARRAPWALPVSLVMVGCFFLLGSRSPVSGHQLLNAVLGNSVRVAARYQSVVMFAWPLFIAAAWRARADLRQLVLRVVPVLPVVWLINLAFFPVQWSWSRAREWLRAPAVEISEMREIAVVPERARGQSHTWPAMRAGLAVSNCYDPIWRVNVFTSEHNGRPELLDASGHLRPATYRFIESTDEACVRDSYFTQQDVWLSPSCGRGTCVNLNEPHGGGLVFDQAVQKFCVP